MAEHKEGRFVYASHMHRMGARLLIQQAEQLEISVEAEVPLAENDIRLHTYVSYISSAIVSIWAYIEAIINEFSFELTDKSMWGRYQQGVTPSGQPGPGIPRDDLERMATFQRLLDVRNIRVSALDKYQLILAVSSAAPMEHGSNPMQDVDRLRKFRNNFLIHSTPLWESEDKDHSVEKTLSGFLGSQDESQLAPDSAPYFPYTCLAAPLAKKFLVAAETFVMEFGNRLELPHYFYWGLERWEIKKASFTAVGSNVDIPDPNA